MNYFAQITIITCEFCWLLRFKNCCFNNQPYCLFDMLNIRLCTVWTCIVLCSVGESCIDWNFNKQSYCLFILSFRYLIVCIYRVVLFGLVEIIKSRQQKYVSCFDSLKPSHCSKIEYEFFEIAWKITDFFLFYNLICNGIWNCFSNYQITW